MATLTQSQIDALRNKGLSDEKIQAIATQRGFDVPKESFGSALIKSERGFGQSIAGAIGGAADGKPSPFSMLSKVAGLEDVKSNIETSNQLNRQVQDNLLKAIQDKRAKGEDTSRLVNALKTLDSEINFYDILNTSTGGSLDKSAKQVLGEGAGVATDILGAGALPGGIGQIAKAKTFGQGVMQGARAGAVGGSIFGTAQGAARAAQEDKTGGEIVGAGIGGGLMGAAAGGVIGGTIGGVSGAIAGRGQKVAQTKQDFVLDLVSENPTKKVSEQAIREGRVAEPSLFGKARIIPSTKDYRLADAVDEVVSTKNTPFQNVDAINQRVAQINSGVKNLITQKKVPFNTNQLRTRLNAVKEESKLIFASDTNAENTYNAVVDEFMKHLQKKDTLGLFEARQSFDKIPAIKKLLQSEGLGENVKKQIVLDVRRAANEYIASLLPANNPYRALLRQESAMLEAVGNIAEKNATVIGKSKLAILTQKYPILKWLVGGAATGIVGAAGVGVGGAIIGSTD